MEREERTEQAVAELKAVADQLRDERKILRRDWEALAPRERSQRSRRVRELEERQARLEEQVESDSAA